MAGQDGDGKKKNEDRTQGSAALHYGPPVVMWVAVGCCGSIENVELSPDRCQGASPLAIVIHTVKGDVPGQESCDEEKADFASSGNDGSLKLERSRRMESQDPFWKLRPPEPTPEDEICGCEGTPPIVLQPHLSSNPLTCTVCNLEVPPERIGFSAKLAEALASWQSFHDCFEYLWLDSGEFERWAKAQLCDIDSPVHRRGLGLREQLSRFRPCYYWWFQDSGAEDEDFVPLAECPKCGGQLRELGNRFGWLACEACWIVVAN